MLLGEDPDPVFGLTGETLVNRVRATAQVAGLGDRFTGHSDRIGMARRMVKAERPTRWCGAKAGGSTATWWPVMLNQSRGEIRRKMG